MIIETIYGQIVAKANHYMSVPGKGARKRIIKDEKIVEKKELKLPKKVTNVIKCKNPRCITSIEQGLDQIFVLADKEKEVYRCKYCEEKYTGKRNK